MLVTICGRIGWVDGVWGRTEWEVGFGETALFLFTRFLSDHWTFFVIGFISVFKAGFHSNITRVLFSL